MKKYGEKRIVGSPGDVLLVPRQREDLEGFFSQGSRQCIVMARDGFGGVGFSWLRCF